MRDLLLTNIFKMGKNKQHLKIICEDNKSYECVGFNMAYLADDYQVGDKVDVLFQVGENNFNNERKVQFLLKMKGPQAAEIFKRYGFTTK